jgi:cell division protein FtsB
MKALLVIFSLLLILLLVGLWVGPGSYPERWRVDNRKLVQESDNQEKKEQIRKIQAELDDISTGKDALEERARSHLGMTKKGETFFEVILQPEKDEENKADINSTTSNNKKTINE